MKMNDSIRTGGLDLSNSQQFVMASTSRGMAAGSTHNWNSRVIVNNVMGKNKVLFVEHDGRSTDQDVLLA